MTAARCPHCRATLDPAEHAQEQAALEAERQRLQAKQLADSLAAQERIDAMKRAAESLDAEPEPEPKLNGKHVPSSWDLPSPWSEEVGE